MNRKVRVSLVGLVMAMVLSASFLIAAQKKSEEPIKVYVFTATNPGGFVDPDQKQRTDSVEDLKRALGKKDLVQVVDQKDSPDVTLEVLGRGDEETGTSSTTTSRGYYGIWGSTTSKDTVAAVHVRLKAGNYSTLIEGRNDGRITNVWWTAANNAAKQIQRWIKENHDRLIALRPK
jgi:hypothetical protein